MNRRIFINGRFLTQPVAGVQRYARELMRQFDILIGDNASPPLVELICLIPPEKIVMPAWNNIELKIVGINKGKIWEQIDLPFFLKGQLLFSPANIGPFYYRNQVVTLHDASVFAVPEAYSPAFRTKYKFVFRQLVTKARSIITDSKFSQDELAKYLHVPSERFQVIYLGADHLNYVQADHHLLEKYSLHKKPYILMVASVSPHKNYARVIEAIKLVRADVQFVFVGGNYQNIFNTVDLSSLPKNVCWLGGITDSELKTLYENAVGFIFPSLYEGFGIPPLEAMQCGCPVLCSATASLPEVVGEAALYFDPLDVNQIAATIEHFLSEPNLHETLREKGYQRSAEFHWSKTARSTLDILFGYL